MQLVTYSLGTKLISFISTVILVFVSLIIIDVYIDKGFLGDLLLSHTQTDTEEQSKSIAVVLFDIESRANGLEDDRKTIFRIADKLLAAGSKVVILDYTFNNDEAEIPFKKEYANQLVFGSSIHYLGNERLEERMPANLFDSNVPLSKINSGHILIHDSIDYYPTTRSLKHFLAQQPYANWKGTAGRGLYPSLSLTAYYLGEFRESSSRLRNRVAQAFNDTSTPAQNDYVRKFITRDLVDPNVRLLFPSLPHYFPRTSASAVETSPVEFLRLTFQDKYVFISSCWDRQEDYYSYGESPCKELAQRALSRLNFSAFNKNQIPGVYIHATALANMLGEVGEVIQETNQRWRLKYSNIDLWLNLAVFVLSIFVFNRYFEQLHDVLVCPERLPLFFICSLTIIMLLNAVYSFQTGVFVCLLGILFFAWNNEKIFVDNTATTWGAFVLICLVCFIFWFIFEFVLYKCFDILFDTTTLCVFCLGGIIVSLICNFLKKRTQEQL